MRPEIGARILEHTRPPPKAIANLSKGLPLPQAERLREIQRQPEWLQEGRRDCAIELASEL
jgi:hypothetical protein